MAVEKMAEADVMSALSSLDGWSYDADRPAIKKSFKFNDFKQAFGFMTQCAMLAEELGHHPEWFNVYNTVEVTLTTHDVDGISELDLKTAKAMNGWA